jgi:flagellar export protein FliJ
LKRFAFRLERLLQWRTVEQEREERRLQALFSEAERLEAERIALETRGRLAEESVLRPDVLIEERQALGDYRRFLSSERQRLMRLRTELQSRIEAQRLLLVEAERKVEALTHMRDAKLAEWRSQTDKEQGDFVDELVVARWKRPA